MNIEAFRHALKEDTFGAVLYMDDRFFMQRVLRLARRGTGRVSPNPRVGALVVKRGRVLAEGYHAYFGGPHAEVVALSKIDEDERKGATLYVNLEPCVHHGKTPPCTELIIRSRLRRVVVGAVDPNPLVREKGIQKLLEAGIEVQVGVRKEECIKLNKAYFKYITQEKPFITLKIAQTLDGKIATADGISRWITSEASRRFVHRMRRESDAVLVGVNTVIADDPELTVRWGYGTGVRRIVLDSRLRIPEEARVLHHPDPEKTIVATTPQAASEKIQMLRQNGVSVWVLDADEEGRVDLSALWKKMAQEGMASVLVEGGKVVFTSILRDGEADRIVVFIAPKLFGKGISAFGDLGVRVPDGAMTFREIVWRRRGVDMVLEGEL